MIQTIRNLAPISTDDLSLSQPASQFLVGDAARVAATVSLGSMTAGTSLVFSLHSSITGQTYLSTSANAVVLRDGTDRWAIEWEDWTDYNYSDVTMLICYVGMTPGCGLPADRTFGSGAFGNGSSFQAYQAEPVNTATGNYVSQALDAHLPGRGLPVDFVRSYNSLSTDIGDLGKGWTSSFAAHLVLNADGSVTFVAEDGSRTPYAPDGAGGFVRPPGAYGSLSATGGGYDLLRRDQIRLHFGTTGLLENLTDRNGNAITLAYASGRLATITDTVGRQLTLGYDGNGRLASLAYPPSRSVTYTYTPGGLLETVTDADGGVTTYSYDAADRLATIIDQDQHTVVTNTYGTDGRVSEQVDARDFHTTYAWNATTETSTMTDARGGAWVDDYDAGILMSRADPLGNTTRYSFDANRNASAIIDPRGLQMQTTVDSLGNLTLVSFPAPTNYNEAWTYTARNDPLTHRDRRGNTTTSTYDTAGNLKTVTGPAPLSPLTTFNYDPSGNGLLMSVVDPRGKTTVFGYDGQANRNRLTTALGNITTMSFDQGGRMATLVDPRGNVAGADPAQYTTTFTYDGADRVRTTTAPLGAVTTVDYDLAGNRTAIIDANLQSTSFEYDAANHLTAVVDPLARRTTYAYDETGNLVMRTDANTHLTTYAYDLASRLVTQTQPMGRVWTYEYDPDGNVTKVVDPIASATPTTIDYQSTATYDEFNHLATQTFYGNQVVSYGYDANGNRTLLDDAPGASSYAYDVLNRLTTYHRAGGITQQITYAYDLAGNVTSRTYLDGTVESLTYDDDGRLATVAGGGATTTYGYDPAANLISTTLPSGNGYVESRTYDRSGRLTEVKNQKGATVLSRSTYTLDPVGNRLASQTTTETTTYTYDPLDRLTKVCYTVACTSPGDNFRQYTYDFVGNRLTEVRDTGTTTYAYDAADQLTGTTGPGGTASYTYDLDGRTLTAGTQTYTWAQPDRLATLTQGSTTTTYTYDGDGLRLQASTGTQAAKKTNFEWDVNSALPKLVAERDGSGGLVRRYLNGLVPISETAGTKTAYYAYDGLGSVVNLTSSTGATWWTYAYLPFGGVRTATKNNNQAIDNVLRFAGGYLDPTGLYHLGARQYDSGAGRFLSTDPVSPGVGDPYVGAYVYANNNPVRFTDTSGRCPWCIGAVIGFFAYGIGVMASNVAQNNSDLLSGWNPTDAIIATGAGALSGGLSSLGMTTGEQVIFNGVIGFDATAASMAFGGRRNPAEIALGTAFGAVGPLAPGSTGFFRGLASSSALNGLMNWLLAGGPLQMGGTSK
ncbi:MAG: RHS repeat protein [Chloroflexi bacterium]|nr:RHS repeat protein [Chloroflexota bacterium]